MSLIPNAFLFESNDAILKLPNKPGRRSSVKPLDERYQLNSLQSLDGKHPFATMAVGWHSAGLTISCSVQGKTKPPTCDPNQLPQSDGLQLWIDTRNTPGVHRANRFCHQFVALPTGGGDKKDAPLVQQIEIARCREPSPLTPSDSFWTNSEIRDDGYDLTIWFPAEALNAYDPVESPRLGFFYAVHDEELGLQTPSVGEEFPFSSDPTLWHSIELTE